MRRVGVQVRGVRYIAEIYRRPGRREFFVRPWWCIKLGRVLLILRREIG